MQLSRSCGRLPLGIALLGALCAWMSSALAQTPRNLHAKTTGVACSEDNGGLKLPAGLTDIELYEQVLPAAPDSVKVWATAESVIRNAATAVVTAAVRRRRVRIWACMNFSLSAEEIVRNRTIENYLYSE